MSHKPPLVLYDTLARAELPLEPPQPGQPLRLYTCGPTVYNRVHIGNLRAFLVFDLLRRTLEWYGYEVRHVMNITDVDDKTIRDSIKAGESLTEFTARYTELFFQDLDALRIRRAHVTPKATDAIDDMVALIQDLARKGVAYQTEDGSWFFKIEAFPDYGKLSQLDRREIKSGAGGRVSGDEYEKDSVQDFALWKAYKPDADGDVFWDTPIGKGRPGWHLECSALAEKHLGPLPIDIHCGGVDLIFPHHENEIAQSEAARDETFSRRWLHNEHLLVGGKKMSKSLGNFYTLSDLAEQARATPREVRYALLTASYRKQVNFQVTYDDRGRPQRFDSVEDARKALARLDGWRQALAAAAGEPGQATEAQTTRLEEARTRFAAAICHDLNASGALAALFELERDLKSLTPWSGEFAGAVQAFLADGDEVLGVLEPDAADATLPPQLQQAFEGWVAARAAKDWPAADRLRDELKAAGIGVKAGAAGSSWYRL